MEGDLSLLDEYANPKVFWGTFILLQLEEGIPILFSPDQNHTAHLLETLYRRQEGRGTSFGLRHKPKLASLQQQQEFAVQGLPSVGNVLSKSMLERFGTVRKVMAATESELLKVPKIGQIKARQISDVLDAQYEKGQRRLDE